MKNDLNYKLRRLLRTRMHTALKGNFNSGIAVKLLGCTIPEFKSYLEKQFTEGMNWNNRV